ncbi:intermembrane phospholipid transport protein YdbH family protein [Qipengyuania sphaerica]|uniref:intermembrane phospholipid transport protein YdbH family protein n=1 Tax=Qipengyuania sphaerica TaxID=2867243 RepID=UPI001C87611E|nr:YdbH domain-containing protein [Qipengyuania sphaerica]MBX7540433.1 YdbH domain-containing protein [Qipengyuania sphaerica]
MYGSSDHIEAARRPRWRKKRYNIPALVLSVLFVAGLVAWFNRIDIANDFIADQLEANGLPGTYTVERIGGRTQIISDLVIGDPQAPDLTAERVIVRLRHRFGLPEVAGLTLVNPRIYGRYVDGELSLGSLDSLLFDDSSDEPSGLPDIDLVIRDGRGLVETDYGPVGLKISGEGNLVSGFEGILAASAPDLAFNGCKSNGTTLYGKITTSSAEPSFSGPLRVAAMECDAQQLSVNDLVAEIDATTNALLADPQLEARIASNEARYGSNSAQSLAGTVRAQLKGDAMTSRYSLAARGVETPQALAAVLTAEGMIRSQRNFAALEVESDIEGNGLRLGRSLIAAIEGMATSGDGTLLEPIARRIGSALQSETRGSSLAADLRYRSDEKGYSLLLPQGELTGGSGARLLSLSRLELTERGDEPPRIAGNIATGGPGIPRISGRMERSGEGDALFRLSMAPYEAGGSQIAIPRIMIAQGSTGALGFSGEVEATGPLPGGAVDQLSMPVTGRWEPGGQLSMWRECTRIGFRRLAFAELNLAGPGLTLCPPPGKPMLQFGSGGSRFAAGAPSLNLTGALGDTPVRIASGPVGFGYPGTLTARNLDISLGPADTASRFVISDLDAQIGDNIAGTFDDAEIALAAVPMTLMNTAGNWDYTNGRLTIGDASFRLIDREEPDRFEPLVARGAGLTLVDNIINAEAALRNPGTDRVVTLVDIRHDLSTGGGHANLDVEGLTFDEALQPEDLSPLALGVIANADGTITGTGRIDWSPSGEVTSTGSFSSENIDFAAAFGPVKGASGTVEFTDLLNLTTAPNQKIRIASVNPGIEVLDGEIEFSLQNGELLAVSGGSWPFMGGRLILREVDLNLGISEERAYVFEIVGLDAAQFVAQMELENISATGIFDGTVPIIFDANGNGRIEEGILLSRPPGGNISYVGELTYEDLSAIANFAFDALRSLDYSQMRVIMNGPLTGEIVTQVRFDGVRQGEDAKSNFITKQLAKLPLQFRINIKAQFYQLITSVKAMYDPASVRDPRELGLLSDDGKRLLRRSITGEEVEPDIDPEDVIPDEPTIQDQESE